MTHLLADLRLAARSLARAPLFTFVAVVSIALGIGANTAVFTLLDQVALRPLPIERPDELVQIHARGEENYGGGSGNGTELSWPMFRDFQDKAAGFAGIVGRVSTSMHVGHQGSSERVEGDMVSGNFFEVLGVGAALGRVFTPADDRTPGGHPLAVLGYDFWRRRFLGRADVVGQPVLINGQPFTVIGVAARGFYGLQLGVSSDVYVPVIDAAAARPRMAEDRRSALPLGPGLRTAAARRQLREGRRLAFSRSSARSGSRKRRSPSFERASSETRKQFLASSIHVVEARQGQASLQRELAPSLMILMAVAAGVLLIACANVANLLIARGAARERELALRRALGAGRGRLAWLLVAEALVLAAVGSVFGLLLATWGAGLLVDVFSTTDAPTPVTTSPDLRVVAFTTAIAILTALVSGLAPALRAAKGGVSAALKAAGGGVVREEPRLRKTLVVVQVALSFLMLATAGLFVRSLDNLLRVHPGFVTSQVTSFSVDLERSGYADTRSQQFARALHERLQALPGVDAAGLALFGILEGGSWAMAFTIEGFSPKPGERAGSMVNGVSPGYFEALRAPIVRGRAFGPLDARTPPKGEEGWPYRTAIVNETFVKRYFGGRDPIGRHVGFGSDPATPMPMQIVGVVADAKYTAIREEPRAQIFVPAFENRDVAGPTFYLRSALPPATIIRAVRQTVASMDPALPVFNVATLEQRVAGSLRTERLVAGLSAAFATLATLLALVGLYGVMSYTVTRRSREIGIRMALGARAAGVAGQVVREAALLIAGGLLLAIVPAWWLKGFISTELYGIKPADPLTLALAASGLVGVGLLAAGLPARRAARVDPMTALRDE